MVSATIRLEIAHYGIQSRKRLKGRVEPGDLTVGRAYLFPPLSAGGASRARPCPDPSTPSSNRTCGLPASGSPVTLTARHASE
jgi:hypothetical protein